MRYFFLSLFLLFAAGLFAQKPVMVHKVTETMSKGSQPGYAIEIYQASLEVVKKAWVKQIQENTKSKPVESGHEIVITGAINNEVSPESFNLYTLLLDKDSLVYLVTFFELDSGVFFDPNRKQDDLVTSKVDLGIQNYMQEFAVEQYLIAVESELDQEGVLLKELNKELKDYQSEQEKEEKSIKSNEQKISSAEDEIKMLTTQNTSILEQIEAARIALTGITDKDAQKIAKKELSSLEKEKKKMDSELEKQNKAIVGYETDIKESNETIEKLGELQEQTLEKIGQQEELVNGIEVKLKGIR